MLGRVIARGLVGAFRRLGAGARLALGAVGWGIRMLGRGPLLVGRPDYSGKVR